MTEFVYCLILGGYYPSEGSLDSKYASNTMYYNKALLLIQVPGPAQGLHGKQRDVRRTYTTLG